MKKLLVVLFLPACSADAFSQLDGAPEQDSAFDVFVPDSSIQEDVWREDAKIESDGGIDVISPPLDAGLDAPLDAWDGSCPSTASVEPAGSLACGTSTCSSQLCCEFPSTFQCMSSSCGSGDYWVWKCSSTEQCGSGKVCTANVGSTMLTLSCPVKLVLKSGTQALIDCSTTSWGYQFCASDAGCPGAKKCMKTEVSLFGGSTIKTVGLCQ